MRICLLLALCVPAFAQTTTVTGTIRDPAGDPLAGSCSIQAVGPFTAAAGWRVIGAPTVVTFSGGAFTASLAPTDSATPSGQYYKVTCAVPKQTVNGHSVGPFSWGPRYWLVPTSASSLDIGTVELTSPPPSPSWTILPQQIAGALGYSQMPALSYTATVSTAEYTDGSITVTNGSDEVTGIGTAWTSSMTGYWLATQPCLSAYRFTYVSATSGTLDRPYTCASGTMRGVPSPPGTPYGHAYALTQSTYVASSTHGLGTVHIILQCFDAGVTAQRIQPAAVLVWPNQDVEILWRRATTGSCILNR
jgi:hypothetical protein